MVGRRSVLGWVSGWMAACLLCGGCSASTGSGMVGPKAADGDAEGSSPELVHADDDPTESVPVEPSDASESEAEETPSVDPEPEESDPSLRFVSPASGAEVANPVRFVMEGTGIAQIRLSADGWEMARWPVDRDGWSVDYAFSDTGRPRTVLAEGLDADGERVVAIERTIVPLAADEGLLGMPYFYQYDNAYEPAATCGLTSTAMVLEHWTRQGILPDDLYLAYGKAQAQSPSGIAQLLAWQGLDTSYSYTGTRAQLRSWLDSGRPVIVHGYWTDAGHIAVLIGYDASDWIVHDPAGDWEVCYGCGGGEAVRYARGGAWDQQMSVDGDIWFSVSDPVRL